MTMINKKQSGAQDRGGIFAAQPDGVLSHFDLDLPCSIGINNPGRV